MYMQKITTGISRDFLNFHISKENFKFLFYFQCGKYMKKCFFILYLFQFNNSCLKVSRSSSSFTFLTISPFLIKSPSPIPPAIPISASFASPGPFTTHPITATLISSGMSATISSTWFASLIRLILVLPQVGQDTTSIPPLRSPSVLRISFAVRISSTGSPVRETRIVLPIPSWRMIPSPTEDFTFPEYTVPDSVIPT